MQHFDDAAVTALIDHAELVDATAAAFADLGTGRAATTVRVRASAMGSMASAMAAAVPSLGVTGGKLYSTVDGRFTFHVVLFDLDGRLLCTMDGAALTEARTPALCAVAIRRWVGGNADVAAVLGTGREALPHLRMLARELPGAEFRLWGRRSSAAESVVRVAASEGIAVVAVDDADDAVTGADVVATKPQRCELDPELFGRARAVVTDSLEGAPGECGDLIRAVALGRTRWEDVVDLSDVLAGTVAVSGPDERPGPLVFETQGVAIQDVVAAALVWRRAEHHSPEPVTDRSAIDRSATDQEASR
ncbi:MAG: hypothetical protein ACO4CU_01630 [Ilumatobacteraceae bacterium]